jgi:serine protease autotransporter
MMSVCAVWTPGYGAGMTTTPNEPVEDPQVVPSGDPPPNPITPGERPDTDPDPDPDPAPDTEPEPV